MNRLHQIDANLLVALDVLLEERQVTRAADRLGVTQPAMSQTLQRLREALDDPLLVRSGSRMVATPRAEKIQVPLRAALRALERTIEETPSFDPSAATRVFRLACLDTYAPSVLPRLFSLVADAGPGLEVDVLPLRVGDVYDQLRSGEVDVAILGPRSVPSDIHAEQFVQERMVSMVREQHPILASPITTEAYVRWPHSVFRITGRGDYPIDQRLAQTGLKRRIAGRTPYFLVAASLVVDSDLIVTLPSSAATAFARRWPVTLFEPPLPGDLRYWTHIAWASFLEADPGHRWFRGAVAEIGADISVEG